MTPSTRASWLDPGHLNYRRGLVLMAFGAVAGLVLAAIGLFTARGTSTLVVPPEDVALVNQQPINRSDYAVLLRAIYDTDLAHATPAQRHKVLDDMIREELFVQRGAELDVASADPAVRAAMVSAVEQQSATDAMTQLPSDQKLLAYYHTHKDRYSSEGFMALRDLVFPAATSAAALAKVVTLKPDQAVTRLGARDSGRTDPDEFYFAAPIHLGNRLAKIAEAMADGAVSQPFVGKDGIHVIYMARNTRPVLLDFAAARERVLEDYRRDLVQSMLTHEQKFLRERANILIAGDMQ